MAEPLFIVPPKNLPWRDTWMYEAFRRLNARSSQTVAAIAAIGRGEAPDGSGSPLLDLSDYFFLPGRTGGQTSYQSDKRSPTLTMTQPTVLSDAAELLRFYTAGKMVKFKPTTFSVVCSTAGTTTLTATGTPNFAPTGGPRVTEGMLITGDNIPAGTYVRRVVSGVSLIMSQAASGSGATTVTFESSVDVSAISDETGRDVEWRAYGSVRFTPGTEGIPLRVSGDFSPVATGGSSVGRLYLEAGYISSGSAFGTSLQIGGPNRGELADLTVSTRLLSLNRNPVSGTNINIGVGINPAEFGSGGPDVNLLMVRTATTGIALVTAGSSTNSIFAVGSTSLISGTSPAKTFSIGSAWFFKITEDQRVHFGNAAGGGFYLQGSTDAFNLTAESTGIDLIAGSTVASWSDSVTSHAFNIGGLIGGTARRVFLASSGYAIFDRFGIGSTYILLTDAQAGNADFLTGTGDPMVRLYNTVSSHVVLELRNKSGLTGHALAISDAGTTRAFIRYDGTMLIEKLANGLSVEPLLTLRMGGTDVNAFSIRNGSNVEVVGINGAGELAVSSFTLRDTGGTGFNTNFSPSGTWGADNALIVPNITSGQGTLVIANDGGDRYAVLLDYNSTLRCNTSSQGVSFQDNTTSTKRLRIVLSGSAASGHSLTFTHSGTGARNYGFGSLGGNVVIVGDDPPTVASNALGKVDLTAQVANITTTNLSSTPPAGSYEVTVYIICTTQDATAGTLTVTIGWTDAAGAKTDTSVTVALTSTANVGRAIIPVQVSSGDITYAVANGGTYGTAQYAIYVRVKHLG